MNIFQKKIKGFISYTNALHADAAINALNGI